MRRRLGAAALVLLSIASPQAQQPEVRIRAARLLDGTGQILENATVVVRGESIAAIELTNSTQADIDLGQSTLLPGLIDVHAHIGWHFGATGRFEPRAKTPGEDILYAAENAYLTLMAGFTTIQSPGQPGDIYLRDAIARGTLPGPRILTSVFQITPNNGTPSELRQTVRDLKNLRGDVVKIIASVSRAGIDRSMTARSVGGALHRGQRPRGCERWFMRRQRRKCAPPSALVAGRSNTAQVSMSRP